MREASVPDLAGLGLTGCLGFRVSRPPLFLLTTAFLDTPPSEVAPTAFDPGCREGDTVGDVPSEPAPATVAQYECRGVSGHDG